MMAGRLRFDTDVLIDYLRDLPLAVDFLERVSDSVLVSAVSVGELFAGVRDGEERIRLKAFLGDVEIVPLDGEAAENGGLYQRRFGRSHNVGLPDALIAASSELRLARLVTLNRKHFPMLHDVLIPCRKSTGS